MSFKRVRSARRHRELCNLILTAMASYEGGVTTEELAPHCSMTPCNLSAFLVRLQFKLPTVPGEKRRVRRISSKPAKWRVITKC